MMITVIGRGHGGTRAMSHTLSQSGVYMGAQINDSGDLVPPEELYEACRVFAKYVTHRGGLEWDFTRVHSSPIDPAFTSLVESYLSSVITSDSHLKGWKIPETTLIFPWIIRLFPDIKYIYWLRDPRDSILGAHCTDDLKLFGINYDPTEDILRRRAISWIYQYELMLNTPPPQNRIEVRFEDFILKQDETLAKLSAFLGIPLAKIEVRLNSVGRWKAYSKQEIFDIFPKESLYCLPEQQI